MQSTSWRCSCGQVCWQSVQWHLRKVRTQVLSTLRTLWGDSFIYIHLIGCRPLKDENLVVQPTPQRRSAGQVWWQFVGGCPRNTGTMVVPDFTLYILAEYLPFWVGSQPVICNLSVEPIKTVHLIGSLSKGVQLQRRKPP